jgi:hypothetical protein
MAFTDHRINNGIHTLSDCVCGCGEILIVFLSTDSIWCQFVAVNQRYSESVNMLNLLRFLLFITYSLYMHIESVVP